MKYVISAIALLACCASSEAKVFDLKHMPKNSNQLKYGDSFHVDCRNQESGVIDRETLDVNQGTVTIDIPGKDMEVHQLKEVLMNEQYGHDQFGERMVEIYTQLAGWDKEIMSSDHMNIVQYGHGLLWNDGYYLSIHNDNSYWRCAAPEFIQE